MQIDLIDFLTILGKTDLENRICSDEEMEELVHKVQACVLYRNKDAAEGIQGVAFAFPYQNMGYYDDTHKQLKKMSMKEEQSTFDVIFSIMAAQKKEAMKDPNYQSDTLNEALNNGGDLNLLLEAVAPRDYTEQDWYVKGFEDYDTAEALVDIPLKETAEGYQIEAPEKTWNIITDCQTMVYRETGKDGQRVYLGRDHIGSEDAEGHPLISMDGNWVSIGGQTVCYEAEPVRETKQGDVYSGLVRARLNGEDDIILHVEWDPQSDPNVPTEGHVTGYEMETSSLLSGLLDTKGTLDLKGGDTIQFIFDTYDKEGNLVKSAPSGDKIRVSKQNRLKVEDTPLEGRLLIGGVLTDMYQRTMTTEMVELSEPAAAQENSLLEGDNLSILMQQVADSEITKSYEEYLPDEALANAEVFGEEDGKAYVYLNTEEFVILKDTAYEMSGGAGEAIIDYTWTDGGIKLEKVEWSADGGDHDKWMEENFPEPYLKESKAYEPYDENGFLKLNTKMIAKAEEELGVPVERENLLEIDTEKGTYKILKTTETGSPDEDNYSFDTETIEEGKLK